MHSGSPLLWIVTIQLLVVGGAAWLAQNWMRRQSDPIKARYALSKIAFQIVLALLAALVVWGGYSWFVDKHVPSSSIPPLLILLVVLSMTRRRYQRILEARSPTALRG